MCLIIILCLCICLRVGLSCRQTADSRDSTFSYDRHESASSGSRRGLQTDGGARPEMGAAAGGGPGRSPGRFFYHFNGF